MGCKTGKFSFFLPIAFEREHNFQSVDFCIATFHQNVFSFQRVEASPSICMNNIENFVKIVAKVLKHKLNKTAHKRDNQEYSDNHFNP